MSTSPDYQIVLHLGPAPQICALRTVDVTPDGPACGPDAERAVVQALTSAGLGPDDFRARILLAVDGCDTVTALAVYAALVGLAGRFVDAFADSRVLPLASLAEQRSDLADAGRPENPVEWLDIGGTPGDATVPVPSAAAPTAQAVSLIRHAWRARLAVPSDLAGALVAFVTVAAVRRKGNAERFPLLGTGTDTPSVADLGSPPDIDAEAVRRAGAALRRSHRPDNRRELVAPVEPTARMLRLRAAAAVPVGEVMVRLGSVLDEEGARWRCPRPERHTNGDRNPSMVQRDGNQVRCARCDVEPLDPLRLVMDVLAMSVDEAAAWIGSAATRQLPGGTPAAAGGR